MSRCARLWLMLVGVVISCRRPGPVPTSGAEAANRVPSFEVFVLPPRYSGPFLAIYDQSDGITPTWRGDTATYQVPKNGILKIRHEEPPHSTHSKHVYADRRQPSLTNYATCADMWDYVPDKRTAVCWLDFTIIGTGIPDHIVAVITNRDGIPLNFERTTAVYDTVLHGNKGRARRRWVMPVDSKIIRSE